MSFDESTIGSSEILTTTDGNFTETTTYPLDYDSLDMDLYQRYEKNRAVSEWVSSKVHL